MTKSSNSGSSFYIIAITVVATLGGLLFGFDSGVINGTVEGLQTAFNSDSAGTGFNVASILLGCAMVAFLPAAWPTGTGVKPCLLRPPSFLLSRHGVQVS